MKRPPRNDEAERLLKGLNDEEREKVARAFAKLLLDDEVEQARRRALRSYR